jgi:hypothetical protein
MEIDLLELCLPAGHVVVSPWQLGASGGFEKGVNKRVERVTDYKLHI